MLPTVDSLLYYLEVTLGRVAGQSIVWAARLAHRRGDLHTFAHYLAALMSGNSVNCNLDEGNCSLMDEPPFDETMEPMGSLEELDFDAWPFDPFEA